MAKTPAPAAAAFDPKAALAKLGAKAKPAAKPAASKERKGVELSDSDQAVLAEMIAVDHIAKIVKGRLDQTKDQATAALFDAYTEQFWREKTRPENPRVVIYKDDGRTPDHDVIYMLAASFSLKQFQDKESPHDAIVEALTAGEDDDVSRLDEQAAIDLVKNEIIAEPRLKMKYSLTDLLEGHFEGSRYVEATADEQVMGQKLLQFLTADPNAAGNVAVAGLTDDERASLIVSEAVIKFKDAAGFLARVARYVKNVHQLRRALSTFSPKQSFTQYHFGINDNPKQRQERLGEISVDLLGLDN